MIESIQQFFVKKYSDTQKTHQLLMLFKRYKNMNKDLVDEYQKIYSRPTNLIVSALYTADYIITSSDVKFEMEDDERRKEIIEFWTTLTLQNEEMWYEITNLVAFTYDIASISRKRYYYLLDKGVAKHIAVALVTDYFIRHLLEFVSSHGGFLPLWWVVFLYETALCQTIFSKTQKKWTNMQGCLHSKEPGILAHLVANHFVKEIEGEPNPAVPIPYFLESAAFYYFKWERDETKCEKFESFLAKKEAYLAKEFKKCVSIMDSENPHILKYLRIAGRYDTASPEINMFVVHAKTENAEGWVGILSPIDDINLKEIESLLQLKLEDLRTLDYYRKEIPLVDVFRRKKDEREIIEEKIDKDEEVGFFKKILSIFKRKKMPKVKEKAVKTIQPIDSWIRSILDEILLITVSGIDLGLEIYDSYREDNFVISGVIESKQKEKQPAFVERGEIESLQTEYHPTIFYSEESVAFPSEFLDPIIGLIEVTRIFIQIYKEIEPYSIIPEEALYQDKSNTALFKLVEFVMSEKLLIGILGEKYVQTAMTYAKGEPVYQRRSIIRKANELLSSRKTFNIVDAGNKTLSREINWNDVKKSYEDKLLFYLK